MECRGEFPRAKVPARAVSNPEMGLQDRRVDVALAGSKLNGEVACREIHGVARVRPPRLANPCGGATHVGGDDLLFTLQARDLTGVNPETAHKPWEIADFVVLRHPQPEIVILGVEKGCTVAAETPPSASSEHHRRMKKATIVS